MSSLSRRACYKCGDLGHHAEACSSPHRLCYNCKQPSESFVATPRLKHPRLITLRPDHESSECPLPRTTEAKQCYHCQGLGHVQADCPTLRISGAGATGRCHNCQQFGHYIVRFPPPHS